MPSDMERSVLQRRGFTLPEIFVTPQDFGDMMEIINSSPRNLKEILQSLPTPKTACLNGFKEIIDKGKCSSESEDTNKISGIIKTPHVIAEENFENYFTDIEQESDDTDSNSYSSYDASCISQSHNAVGEIPSTKHFCVNTKFNNSENISNNSTTWYANGNSIESVNTPPRLELFKKTSYDGDEFDIYFPTSNLVNKGDNTDGVFVFPDDHPEKTLKENYWYSGNYLHQQQHYFCSKTIGNLNRHDATKKLKEALLKPKIHKKTQNELERQRRVDQFLRFQKLRQSIPHISSKRKTAKITILQAAMSYIEQLHDEDEVLQKTKFQQKQRNDYLVRRLCFLTNANQLKQS